jgi:NAD(P)-dependent dehydrogenase (short-subunit alcohol dehydrogenase family)
MSGHVGGFLTGVAAGGGSPGGQEVECVVSPCARLGAVGDEGEAFIARELERLESQFEVAYHGVVEGLGPGAVEADVLRGPHGPEVLALGGKFSNEVGQVAVVGVACGFLPQDGDDVLDHCFPIRHLAGRSGIKEDEACEVLGLVRLRGTHTMAHEVAVIIGAGSIGVAIGRVAGIGRRVLLADYNEETMNAVAGQLRGEGYDVTTHQVDISDHDAVAALADTAAAAGDVTRVVIAAGVSPVQATTERVLRVDLLGTAYVLEEFGRVIAQGGSGVVISSMAGHMGEGYPRDIEHALAYTPAAELLGLPFLAADKVGDSGAAYTLAKRGNALRVQAAATTWGARGARINSLSPGIISTPLAQDEMSGPFAEGYRNMIRTSAAGRMGTPVEVAAIAGYLLGPEGAFITGSDLLMDGGVIAAMRAGQL